jgi:hypothetical protein
LEKERRRHTDFLLANAGRLLEVVAVIDRAIVVAKAVEQFHVLLHDRLNMVRHRLWPYVRHNGELRINVREEEFRRGSDGEMHTREIDGTRIYAVLPGYEMLDPALRRVSPTLERALERVRPYLYGERWQDAIQALTDEQRRIAAETLSRAVSSAVDVIAKLEELRRFADAVNINTLRGWGEHPGCPLPYMYSHDQTHISFGQSDYRVVRVPIGAALRNYIGQIEFWTGLAPRR